MECQSEHPIRIPKKSFMTRTLNTKNMGHEDLFYSQNVDISRSEEPVIENLEWKRAKDSITLSRRQKDKKVRKRVEKTVKYADNQKGLLTSLRETGFKKVIKQEKMKQIFKIFKEKIRKNISSSAPVNYQPYKKSQSNSLCSISGITIPKYMDLIYCLISLIHLILVFFLYTTSLAFDKQISTSYYFSTVQEISIFMYLVQFLYYCLCARQKGEKKLKKVNELVQDYLRRRKFVYDVLVFVILVADIGYGGFRGELVIFRLLIFLKIKDLKSKFEKIEHSMIKNFYEEQYLTLIKVFLTNFVVAHILAILLLKIGEINPHNNWLIKINIQHSGMWEKYIWAYYWGMTTMLTVGFGDISPSIAEEAICMTFIQAFSCILLAYNINCIGSLISNIREKQIKKEKDLRTIRRLAEQHELSEQIESKINNFIIESDKMSKLFKLEKDKEFIENLPKEMKGEFWKQCNKNLFDKLFFFKELTEKSLLTLAQNIQVKIFHPEQIICKNKQSHKFVILRQGKISYCTDLNESHYSGTEIDEVIVKKGGDSKLVHQNMFSNELNQPRYQVKSKGYSIVYQIDVEDALEILRSSPRDIQYFSQLRDKSKHIPNEFQSYQCKFCPESKHSKFICPKLHFSPIRQIVIYKELYKTKKFRMERRELGYLRSLKIQMKPLEIYKSQFKNQGSQHSEKQSKKSIMSSFADYSKGQFFLRSSQFGDENTNMIIERLKETMIEFQCDKTNFFQDFYQLETDELANFTIYFTSKNPNYLKDVPLNTRRNRPELSTFFTLIEESMLKIE